MSTTLPCPNCDGSRNPTFEEHPGISLMVCGGCGLRGGELPTQDPGQDNRVTRDEAARLWDEKVRAIRSWRMDHTG